MLLQVFFGKNPAECKVMKERERERERERKDRSLTHVAAFEGCKGVFLQ